MSSKDVRDGIINAKLMDEGLNILIFEIFLASGVLGYWKHSWGVFWGSVGLFFITLFFKPLAKILIIILSIAWGIGGYLMGRYFFGNSIVSEVVLSCFGVLSSLAVHMGALQRTLESPSKSKSKNKSKPISQNKPKTVEYQENPNYKSKPEAIEDEHFYQAVQLFIETGTASVSLLQRRLRIGYTQAARLMDLLEEKGVVGGYDGSKPREVLMTKEQLELKFGSNYAEIPNAAKYNG